MRGALQGQVRHHGKPGIIPAYAGSTSPRHLRLSMSQDHPRVCGEHSGQSDALSRSKGSSPRMRGAPATEQWKLSQAGIIPAYAGSTPSGTTAPTARWDHPRVCGEHMLWESSAMAQAGSSPRMRGARADMQRQGRGKRDHPRVCGEHRCKPSCAWRSLGSSPRMRGALISIMCEWKSFGIIPAYAGSTGCPQPRRAGRRDHPRVCGEHCRGAL